MTRALRRAWGCGAALAAALLLSSAPSPARAQSGSIPGHRFELGIHGGYQWTFSRQVSFEATSGDADISDSEYLGATLDVNVRPGAQATLLYQRQASRLTFDGAAAGPGMDVADVDVEYFHIGGLAGTPRGNILPYAMFTLGTTRLSYQDLGLDDDWRFSMILGFGAKAYMGERLGLRVQGQIPYTVIDGGGSVACGPAGCVTMIGGTGVGQVNVGGGLFLNF